MLIDSAFLANNPIRSRHDRSCRVCGESAHIFSPDSDPVCLRVECKHVLGKKPHMSETAFKQYLFLQSRQIKWNIRQTAIKKQMLEMQREIEGKEYVECLMRKIKEFHGKDLSMYPHTMVPKNTREICHLPEQRKHLFRDFLTTVIKKAFIEFEDNKDNKTEQFFQHEDGEVAYPMEEQTCSICRGVCCNTGGKNAYIKKETILRYLSEHPDQTQGQVLAAYMAYLGKKTFANSCVYHTKTGCCLPRAMRSDTCNEFLCDTLIELDRQLNKTPIPKGVLLIEYSSKNWRNEILDEENLMGSKVCLLSTTDFC